MASHSIASMARLFNFSWHNFDLKYFLSVRSALWLLANVRRKILVPVVRFGKTPLSLFVKIICFFLANSLKAWTLILFFFQTSLIADEDYKILIPSRLVDTVAHSYHSLLTSQYRDVLKQEKQTGRQLCNGCFKMRK